MKHALPALFAGAALLGGCAAPAMETRRDAAAPAISALRQGRFDEAERLARLGVDGDSANPYVLLTDAIVRYKKISHQLVKDGRTVIFGGLEGGGLNQRYLHVALTDAEAELAKIEAELAIVAKTPGLSVELCLACWEEDWNGNGRVDERDRLLFQVEVDEKGEALPEDDPRRKPTFRFDDGDVAWARAFISFERAAIDVLLAYDWSEVGAMAAADEMPERLVIKLVEPGRVAEAKVRILEGLALSDASRVAYLAETDDDREWVPNPHQKSHPMPLPVDGELYETWEQVIVDVRRIVEGEEGLAVADLIALTGERMKKAPGGYLDVGHMFDHPGDITLDLSMLRRLDDEEKVKGAVSSVFGSHHVKSMKPSPLPVRLLRMMSEIDRGEGELDRKLRYLIWIN